MHNAKITGKEMFSPTDEPRMALVKKKKVFVLPWFIHVTSDSTLSVLISIFT